MNPEGLKDARARLQGKCAEDVLSESFSIFGSKATADGTHPGKAPIALASSLGAEDQVLTHMVLSLNPDARIFVLDTGRFHSETYELMERTRRQYGMRYEVYFPQAADVEEMESVHGPNLFYESVENRRNCCLVRKVKPLRRALSTLDAWITGLRKEQTLTRSGVDIVEWDEANGLLKINPLSDWSERQVWDYIRRNGIPYSRLHDEGYPSIGCAPCTRKISPGEDIRAGRWWWEKPGQKECGLHPADRQLAGRA